MGDDLKRRASFMQAPRFLPVLSGALAIAPVQNTIAAVRLQNLERLVAEFKTLDAVAALADSSSVYLSQLRTRALDRKTQRPREMGSVLARRLEAACDKPVGWMDQAGPEDPESAVPTVKKRFVRPYSDGAKELAEMFEAVPDHLKEELFGRLEGVFEAVGHRVTTKRERSAPGALPTPEPSPKRKKPLDTSRARS